MQHRRGPKLGEVLGLACFSYMLARPFSSNQVLIPVLAVLGALGTARLLLSSRRLHPLFYPIIAVQAGPGVPLA